LNKRPEILAAETLGLNATTLEIRRSEDIGPTFEKVKGHRSELNYR
jgi:hypothetical protein